MTVSSEDSHLINLPLEEALANAFSGDRQTLNKFLRAFYQGPLIIPDRNQLHIPLNVAEYPNDFLRVLGIKDGERTIVPIFSRIQFALEWTNHPVTTHISSGEKLAKLLPEDWWICVNPGQEIEKDLSPWELKKLAEGEKSFDEIINEILSEDFPSLLSVEEVANLPELVQALVLEAQKFDKIVSIQLGKHQDPEHIQSDEELILAIVLDSTDGDERSELKARFESVAAPFLIGHGSLRVMVEDGSNNIAIEPFRHLSPIYSKSTSSRRSGNLIARSFGSVRSWLKNK